MTFAEWMRRVASGAPALVLVVAQTASGFVDLRAVDTPAPAGQVLFLPLDRSFTGCVPLDAVCPPDSSTVVLIPAAGRSIAWVPDGAELPASDDAIPDVD